MCRRSASLASCITRMDGDARGGAALSMRAVTGAPIKLVGSGEKLDALEDFHPERVASRILGMGDIVSLVERASRDHRSGGSRKARRQDGRRGTFNLEDYASQLRSRSPRWAACQGILGMLPGVGKLKAQMARRQPGHRDPETPGGDHLLDDRRRSAASPTS